MADFVTLSEAKRYLGIADAVTTDDTLLALIISAATAFFVESTRNPLLTASYTDSVSGDGGRSYTPRYRPITAIASVTVDDEAIPARPSIGEDGYVLEDDRIYLAGYTFTAGLKNVVIAYTAGLAAVPEIVKLAVCELIKWKYERERKHLGQQSTTLGGETVTFQTYAIPSGPLAVIKMYERRDGP